MEYQAVDHIQPTWKITDQFLVDVVAPALELDSLTTSHPVSVDVTDPNEIKAIFDTISYKKVEFQFQLKSVQTLNTYFCGNCRHYILYLCLISSNFPGCSYITHA